MAEFVVTTDPDFMKKPENRKEAFGARVILCVSVVEGALHEATVLQVEVLKNVGGDFKGKIGFPLVL